MALGCAAAPPEAPSMDTVCEDPRPQVCTMNYLPVCGVHADASRSSYANGCSACSDPEVQGYLEGACK